MKYDPQMAELIKGLPGANNILIALPTNLTADQLGAGLALLLSLQQAGKKVSIVSQGTIKVGHSHLFGVGQVQDRISSPNSGNFVLVLGGVAGQDGTVPLEKMDYYTQGSDLNLVFQVLPGQKFEPTHITPKYQSSGFDMIFVIGAASLNDLGTIYSANPAIFSSSGLVNIDRTASNTNFGTINILDQASSSYSEIMAHIIASLNLPFDQDIATNLLAGIFEATGNLQNGNITPDTYEAVAGSLRAGGKKPQPQPSYPNYQPPQPEVTPPSTPFPGYNPVYTRPVSGPSPQPQPQQPPFISYQPSAPANVNTNNQPSPEERPGTGEAAKTAAPESDWLTPKIYKGSSMG